MRGIILAGGRGTRLFPATAVVCKQLLPVYDTPMAFFPLALLMEAGVRDVLIISTPEALPQFRTLFGDGSSFGARMSFAEQDQPRGIAEALLIAEEFVGGDPAVLVLGDNLFIGGATPGLIRSAATHGAGATVFAVEVADPSAFGVVTLNARGEAISLVEKPRHADSNLAVTGLYVYDGKASAMARALAPSPRGELEITDLNRAYLDQGALRVVRVPPGERWFDTGTPDSLLEASVLVRDMQGRSGERPACLEAIAFRHGWIEIEGLKAAARRWHGGAYGRVLHDLAQTASHAAA